MTETATDYGQIAMLVHRYADAVVHRNGVQSASANIITRAT